MDFTKLDKLIKEFDNIVVYHHIQADGDALGSCFGLKQLIQDNYENKKVTVVGLPSSRFDNFFPKSVEDNNIDFTHTLSIVLDTPNTPRIDCKRWNEAEKLVKIDHHILVEHFGDFEWVDTTFCSTCEMIGQIAIDLKWKITENSATFLFLGLVTDSGRFLYTTNPNAFAVANVLIANGAQIKKVYDFIYEEEQNNTRFHGYCQMNFKKTCYGVAYNYLTPDILKQFNMGAYQGSGAVNCLSGMKDIPVWAHFSEMPEGTIKGELRSKGLPVNVVAEYFGGGGHKQASGCILLNWDEADQCIDMLNKMVYHAKPYSRDLTFALKKAEEASKIALDIYNNDKLDIEIKEDESPVTQCDKKIDAYLRAEFAREYPDAGLLSEETYDDKSRREKEYVWIIDPIDGTKDFISHDDEFSINIALSYNHEIVLGIIAVPAKNTIYFATKGGGAFKKVNDEITQIYTSKKTTDLIAVQSRFHQAPGEVKFYERFASLVGQVKSIGSAYKMGCIAEGIADMNLKLENKTKEWDIAPGVIIVNEAGGSFTKPNGEPYTFNREDVVNQEGYIILSKENKGLLLK